MDQTGKIVEIKEFGIQKTFYDSSIISIPKALESLLHSQGFGIEMSGIYISTDNDPENIPDYLTEGIAFEFMDSHVTLPLREAILYMLEWYNHHGDIRDKKLDKFFEDLKEKFL